MKIKFNANNTNNKLEIIEKLGIVLEEVSNLDFDWDDHPNKEITIEFKESNKKEIFLESNDKEVKILIEKKLFIKEKGFKWEFLDKKMKQYDNNTRTFICAGYTNKNKKEK